MDETMERAESVQPPHKDRKVGLIVFGVVEILLGLLCLLLGAFLGIALLMQGQLATHTAPQSAASLVPALIFYAAFATFFIWMGVGSMMGRRWARAIMLIVSVCWLAVGVLAVLFVAILMPRMMSSLQGTESQMPAGATLIVTAVMVVFLSLFFVILPGAFVLFYRSPHVKATCERLDTKERWTDRAPLPVLGLALLLASSVLIMMTPLMGFPMPFFGFMVKAPLSIVISVLEAGLYCFLAVYIFRLQKWAWAATVALCLLRGLSGSITAFRMTPDWMANAYAGAGMPPESLRMFAAVGPSTWIAAVLGWTAIYLGFLLYVRRYFEPPIAPVPESEAASPAVS